LSRLVAANLPVTSLRCTETLQDQLHRSGRN
jgi:hypothetical protein